MVISKELLHGNRVASGGVRPLRPPMATPLAGMAYAWHWRRDSKEWWLKQIPWSWSPYGRIEDNRDRKSQ
jgi:hypothetical protein